MRKIPTLYVRDSNNFPLVTAEVTEGCEWMFDLSREGKITATQQWDGSCCMIDADGDFWKRHIVKKGYTIPSGFYPITSSDADGDTIGWAPVDAEAPGDADHREGFSTYLTSLQGKPVEPATYELVGPNVQSNPYGLSEHTLHMHGALTSVIEMGNQAEIRAALETIPIEGFVFYSEDGLMCKIKRKDFGIDWPAGQ